MISLTSDTTFYIRADGSDSNDGSSNTSGGAFLTLQHAYDVAASSIFLAGKKLTFKMDDGTFDGLYTSRGIIGGGNPNDVVIQGNGDTTVITPSGGRVASFNIGDSACGNAIMSVDSLKLVSPAGYGILTAGGGSAVHYGNITFGAANTHVTSVHNAWAQQVDACVIDDNAAVHLAVNTEGLIATHYQSLTFLNSPDFSYAFVYATGGGRVYTWPLTMTNESTVTGKRFDISNQAFVDMGGNVNNLPGNIAGTTSTNGMYA